MPRSVMGRRNSLDSSNQRDVEPRQQRRANFDGQGSIRRGSTERRPSLAFGGFGNYGESSPRPRPGFQRQSSSSSFARGLEPAVGDRQGKMQRRKSLILGGSTQVMQASLRRGSLQGGIINKQHSLQDLDFAAMFNSKNDPSTPGKRPSVNSGDQSMMELSGYLQHCVDSDSEENTNNKNAKHDLSGGSSKSSGKSKPFVNKQSRRFENILPPAVSSLTEGLLVAVQSMGSSLNSLRGRSNSSLSVEKYENELANMTLVGKRDNGPKYIPENESDEAVQNLKNEERTQPRERGSAVSVPSTYNPDEILVDFPSSGDSVDDHSDDDDDETGKILVDFPSTSEEYEEIDGREVFVSLPSTPCLVRSVYIGGETDGFITNRRFNNGNSETTTTQLTDGVHASIKDGLCGSLIVMMHTPVVQDAKCDAQQEGQLDFVKPANWIEDESDSEEDLKEEFEKPSNWVGEEEDSEEDRAEEFMKPSNWVDDEDKSYCKSQKERAMSENSYSDKSEDGDKEPHSGRHAVTLRDQDQAKVGPVNTAIDNEVEFVKWKSLSQIPQTQSSSDNPFVGGFGFTVDEKLERPQTYRRSSFSGGTCASTAELPSAMDCLKSVLPAPLFGVQRATPTLVMSGSGGKIQKEPIPSTSLSKVKISGADDGTREMVEGSKILA
jgi:hypothetical protein